MRQKENQEKERAEKAVRDIRRATRRRFATEVEIRIVLEGLRGEERMAALCRKEGINQNVYYRGSKAFLEAGKKRLAGDTAREASSDEVKSLRSEASQLKELLAEAMIENRLLKKTFSGMGRTVDELSGLREGRDHPIGRTVQLVRTVHAEAACAPQINVLRWVLTLRRRRPGCVEGRGSRRGFWRQTMLLTYGLAVPSEPQAIVPSALPGKRQRAASGGARDTRPKGRDRAAGSTG